MRIGFDARMIDHPGIGRYIRCLLPEIFRQDKKSEFLLFGDAEKLSGFSDHGNVKIVPWKVPVYSLFEQVTCPYSSAKLDLAHVPHFNVPVLCGKQKIVSTIHDLIYLVVPGAMRFDLGRLYAHFLIGQAVKRSSAVISVSEHTKKDILDHFGEEYSSRIHVIYEAADNMFRKLDDKDKMVEIKNKYGLSDNIILYVGSIRTHKNVRGLIDVYNTLKEWEIPHELVLTGRWSDRTGALKDIIDKSPGIKYLGEVPSGDLVALYNYAKVLVHVSLYEGFGLTVLEAMKCGTPVVVSDTSSLPEIAGDAGLRVSPMNIVQIANTVYNVLVNKRIRREMTKAGLEQVKKFSWEKAAGETLEVYKNVASEE